MLCANDRQHEEWQGQLGSPNAEEPGPGVAAPDSVDGLSINGDHFPCEREISMMEDIKGLYQWLRPSDVSFSFRGASPTQTSSRYGMPSFASSEKVAAAAILAPMFTDSLHLDKDAVDVKFPISVKRAIILPIILFVLLTCAGMYHILENSTTAIRTQAITSCTDALEIQKARVDEIIFENVTVEAFRGLLGSMSSGVDSFVRVPADRAVESLLTSLRTFRLLNESWDGNIKDYEDQIRYRMWVELSSQWGIEDGSWDETLMPRAVDTLPSKGQADYLKVTLSSGQSLGVAVDSYTVECPYAGPVVCGQCQGKCAHLDVISSASPSGLDGRTDLTYRRFDPSTSQPYGDALFVNETYLWSTHPEFAVQQRMAEEASRSGRTESVVATRLWSEVYTDAEGLKLSWTAPLADCGNYACFDGVISADVVLRHVSIDCAREWARLRNVLGSVYDFSIGPKNSSVFIVNHVSENFPDQVGLLLGSSDITDASLANQLGDRRDALDFRGSMLDQELVAATSRAIMDKFEMWNASELLEQDQVFAFRRSYAMLGRFMACDRNGRGADGSYSEQASRDCLQVATRSVQLDSRTRWLIVAVLPAGAFNAHAVSTERLASSKVDHMRQITQAGVNEARVSGAIVFVCIAIWSVGLGALLGGAVAKPLQILSANMQRLGSLDIDIPEILSLQPGRLARIKDISNLQRSFCQLLWGIQAFSRFVPEAVVSRIVRGDRKFTRPHVDKRNVTIMFTCINDFSKICELLGEEQMLKVITRFHTVMTSVVEQFEGSVGEILDDGLLVYWNASDRVNDHAAKACKAALAMEKALRLLEADLSEDGLLVDPCLRLCSGVHTGDVLCGTIGSDTKMKFGCLGDAMNLASRLQGLCKYYGTGVLCSGPTHTELPKTVGLLSRKIDLVQVKGRQAPIYVYEVISWCSREDGEAGSEVSKVGRESPGRPGLRLPSWMSQRHDLSFKLGRRNSGEWDRSTCWSPAPTLLGRSPGGPMQMSISSGGAVSKYLESSQGISSWNLVSSRGCSPSVAGTSSRTPRDFIRDSGNCHLSSGGGTPLSVIVFMEDQVSPAEREMAAQYEEALEAYHEGNFEEAAETCKVLLSSRPQDTATLKLLERANEACSRGSDTKPGPTIMSKKC